MRSFKSFHSIDRNNIGSSPAYILFIRYFKLQLIWPILIIFLLIAGCSTTRTLGKNELLYKGCEVKLNNKKLFEKWRLKNEIESKVRPIPNHRFLGLIKLKLWIYNIVGDSVPEKGFRHWIRTKLGQPPVIYDPVFVEQSENYIRDYLYNKGYFDATINSKTDMTGKKAEVTYFVKTRKRYVLDSIVFPEITDTLSKYIHLTQTGSFLKKGKPYNLDVLKEERERISKQLKNDGFFYFIPDYLMFELDSNEIKKNVNIFLKIKTNSPLNAGLRYQINHIYIHSDYSLEESNIPRDTIKTEGMFFIYKTQRVNPSLVAHSVIFSKGDYYSNNSYEATLNKLTGLGTYKFTNIDFKPEVTDSNLLDANILLTPFVPKSLRAEIQTVTKSNDYVGPNINFSYNDRNFLGSAEHFTINLKTSFETQYSAGKNGGNAFEIGIDSKLSVPRFIFPFINLNRYLAKRYTPRTTISAGYDLYYRTKYFRLNTFNLLYGYVWRSTPTKSHDFKLINIRYSRLTHQSEAFQNILENNDLVKQSFNEELIFGLDYTYTYNNQLYKDKMINTYFSFNPELAGNILSLINFFGAGSFPSPGNSMKLFGLKYSQYARLNTDYRLYTNTGIHSKLVARFSTGLGKAYGNSEILPYTRQFFVGGASDIRAFRLHGVGPGSYTPPDSSFNAFFEQVGDIKIETNLEFRFDIYRMLKGAVFVDAGNVWLLTSRENIPGGSFMWNKVLNEIAVGTGFGLRFDASFFVLRFDLGFPLRKPWLPEGNRWVFKNIKPSNPLWRRENLVLNIAIGYPF